MAPGATVQTATASRRCPDCQRTIDPARRYCDRDRDRRRALTFLEQAERILNPTDRIVAFVAARAHVLEAIEELAPMTVIQQRRAGSSPPGARPAADSRATQLIRGLEVLVGKLADPGLPIDLRELDRYERALADGHRANLLRLSVVEERLLAQVEED